MWELSPIELQVILTFRHGLYANHDGGKAIAALLLEYAALNNFIDHYLAAGGGNNTACGATFLTGFVVFR